jgi:hypothetical protein
MDSRASRKYKFTALCTTPIHYASSVSIYETRLRDTLKITKYLKRQDWQYIHQELVVRERYGKRSVVSHNGRILSQEKLAKERQRYRSVTIRGPKKGESVSSKVVAPQAEQKLAQHYHLPLAIRIRTPSPVPEPAIIPEATFEIPASISTIAGSPQLVIDVPSQLVTNPPPSSSIISSSMQATWNMPCMISNTAPWLTSQHEATHFIELVVPAASLNTKMSILYHDYSPMLRTLPSLQLEAKLVDLRKLSRYSHHCLHLL